MGYLDDIVDEFGLFEEFGHLMEDVEKEEIRGSDDALLLFRKDDGDMGVSDKVFYGVEFTQHLFKILLEKDKRIFQDCIFSHCNFMLSKDFVIEEWLLSDVTFEQCVFSGVMLWKLFLCGKIKFKDCTIKGCQIESIVDSPDRDMSSPLSFLEPGKEHYSLDLVKCQILNSVFRNLETVQLESSAYKKVIDECSFTHCTLQNMALINNTVKDTTARYCELIDVNCAGIFVDKGCKFLDLRNDNSNFFGADIEDGAEIKLLEF